MGHWNTQSSSVCHQFWARKSGMTETLGWKSRKIVIPVYFKSPQAHSNILKCLKPAFLEAFRSELSNPHGQNTCLKILSDSKITDTQQDIFKKIDVLFVFLRKQMIGSRYTCYQIAIYTTLLWKHSRLTYCFCFGFRKQIDTSTPSSEFSLRLRDSHSRLREFIPIVSIYLKIQKIFALVSILTHTDLLVNMNHNANIWVHSTALNNQYIQHDWEI